MRIYLVGSHGVGKTRLVEQIAAHYGLRKLSEVARTELARTERSFADLRNDLVAVSAYQRQVFQEQLRLEAEASDNFVSDRALDNLGYLCTHGEGFHELVTSTECRNYARHVAEGLVFFVRPLDRTTDDGVRTKGDIDGRAVWNIDGMVRLLLELFDIPYVPVLSESFKDRWLLVRAVVDLRRRLESKAT